MRPTAADNPLDLAQGRGARGAAFLRFGLFFGLALVFAVGLVLGARYVLGFKLNVDQAPPLRTLIPLELAQVVATVLAPAVVMALIAREPLARFGLGGSRRLRNLALGVLTGFGAMTILLGLVALCGGVRGWTLALSPGAAVLNGLGYVLFFALVAISEEGLLRGYGLVQLSRAISFWPATIVTSLVFLALHMTHKTENWVGLAQVGVIGVILAYSFRRSGALWFALGCHGAWDFAETYLYGVPDSGVTAPGVLSRLDLQGPVWLTGGAAGPEASWLSFPVLAGIALVVRFALPRWQAPTGQSSSGQTVAQIPTANR